MTPLQAAAVAVAGVLAGTINTVVGSGTLVTFPVLLAVGYPPLTANVSNSLGLAPGSLTGAISYRAELSGRRAHLLRLGLASLAGGITGAVLLLVLPAAAFDAIVPVLVGLAVVLVVVQPALTVRLAHRESRPATATATGPLLLTGVFLTGVYGGYFGAAQGILLLAIIEILTDEDLQRVNAVKNVLATVVNLVAGIVFVVVAHVAWPVVGLLAGGSVVGGVLGARVGRRLSPRLLRAVIVVVGVAAIGQLLSR